MQPKYRMYRRSNGAYYWEENQTQKQGSLKTKDKRIAAHLLDAMNEAQREPALNLAVGRVYLAAHDPALLAGRHG